MSTNSLLLGILMLLIFVVGFVVGRFSSVGNVLPSSSSIEGSVSVPNSKTPISSLSDQKVGSSIKSETVTSSNDETTTIDTSAMSEGQRKMLSALGIDANSITVTPKMMACAEAELGAERMTEITNGDTPSFGEGMKLAACYE